MKWFFVTVNPLSLDVLCSEMFHSRQFLSDECVIKQMQSHKYNVMEIQLATNSWGTLMVYTDLIHP